MKEITVLVSDEEYAVLQHFAAKREVPPEGLAARVLSEAIRHPINWIDGSVLSIAQYGHRIHAVLHPPSAEEYQF